MTQRWQEAFEAFAVPLMDKYEIPGLGIGIQQNDEVIYQKGHGYRHVAKQLPVEENTVFAIGSVTKSFTAMAIMQLQEKGQLSINDSVQQYLPEFRLPDAEAAKQVTLKHLLAHTAGIPPLPSLFFAMKRSLEADPYAQAMGLDLPEDVPPLDDVYDLLHFMDQQSYDLLGQPGEVFSYSNEGFALLGGIIEKVSGEKYEDYIHHHIFQPIGMQDSAFFIEALPDDQQATRLYVIEGSEDGKPYESPLWWDGPAMRPAGFIKSTVADMLKYAQVYCHQGMAGHTPLLKPESIEEMMQPHIEAEPGVYYGYGLMVTPDFFGRKLVEHGGDIKAASAQIGMFPEEQIAGVSLANLSNVPSKRILFSAFNSLFGEDPAVSHRQLADYSMSSQQLQAGVGTYQSSEGMQLILTYEDGDLHLSVSGMDCMIRPVDDDLFEVVMNDQFMLLKWLRDDKQNVTAAYFGFRQFPKTV